MSFYLFVSAIITPIIYFDAVTHHIGRIPNSSGQHLNLSAGLWAVLILFLWPVFGALYLVNRDDLLDRAQKQPVMTTAWRGKAATWLAVSGLLVIGEWYSPKPAPTKAVATSITAEASAPVASEPAYPPRTIDWNTRNPDALTNGNITRAAALFKSSSPSHEEVLSAAEPVLKVPWQYYGQWLCLAGTVALVTDFPPESDVANILQTQNPTEVVFETGDGVIADFFLMNGSGQVQSGTNVIACGYPTGRTEVANTTGGTYTHLVLVGDWRK